MPNESNLLQLNDRIAPLLPVFQKAGIPVYPVGGCVRDALMGREPGDIDLATPALPETVKNLFRRVVDTGIKHGTVTVLVGDEHFEITTFRAETTYSDGRHPDEVLFGTSLIDDLARRDFTVNAAAWDPLRNELIDPYSAQEDCRRGILRAVGLPKERFEEDALRIFRLYRFQSQLGFEIDPATLQAAEETAHRTRLLSAERIRNEWEKLLLGRHWVGARRLAMAAGLFSQHGKLGFLPAEESALCETPAIPEQRWAWHFLDAGNTSEFKVREHLLALKSSRKDKDAILRTWNLFDMARRGHRDPEAYLDVWGSRQSLVWLEWMKLFFAPSEADAFTSAVVERARSPVPLYLSELPLGGNDLQQLGFVPGPALGRTLQWLLAWARTESLAADKERYLIEATRLYPRLQG